MQDVEVKRLAFIRYLYKVGVEQSNQPEPLNATSLLSLHDAAELFLQLAVEHLGVAKKTQNFMDYWDVINQKMAPDQITQEDSMNRLNKARVHLKHHGTAPSKLDMEGFRATVTNFFQENTPKVFDLDFDSVSLIDLVAYENAKSKLRSAQDLMQGGNTEGAIRDIAVSFELLIWKYEQRMRSKFGSSPFFFGPKSTLGTTFLTGAEGRMKDFLDDVDRSISLMQTAIRIISFGFDYRKFSKFQSLTPPVMGTVIGTAVAKPSGQPTLEDCRFCLDYVVECAIKLQEFDYGG